MQKCPECAASDYSPRCPSSDMKSTPLVREVAPRIYSRLVMASCEATTVVHVNQRLTRQTFCSSAIKLAHAQSMNIIKKSLLAIEVDFLAGKLERMLKAIATMLSLPHLRSAPVRMSDCQRARTACVVNLPIPPHSQKSLARTLVTFRFATPQLGANDTQ